jgi:hypothetical protein
MVHLILATEFRILQRLRLVPGRGRWLGVSFSLFLSLSFSSLYSEHPLTFDLPQQNRIHDQREQRAVQHRQQAPRLRAHGVLPQRGGGRHSGYDECDDAGGEGQVVKKE